MRGLKIHFGLSENIIDWRPNFLENVFQRPEVEPQAIPRVLLVDDDPLFGKIMQTVAKLEGIPLKFCKSGREVSRLGKWEFDVFLVDYDLGNITGFQLARFVEKYGKPLPIVIVSEYRNIDRQGWPNLVCDFVHKSIGPRAILVSAIEAYDLWPRQRLAR